MTYVLLVQFQLGAPAFGIAQLIYSLTLVFGYYGFFFWKILKTKDLPFHSIRQLFPSKQANMYWTFFFSSSIIISYLNFKIDLFSFFFFWIFRPFIDPELISLSSKFFQQTIVKHLLTEGDRVILSFASSLYDQGIYALVANYGFFLFFLFFSFFFFFLFFLNTKTR